MIDSKSIFDEDYFEPASEDALTAITVANFTLWVANRLVKIITTHLKSKATIVSYDKMVKNGIPKNTAKTETSKSVSYLIQHRYVKPNINRGSLTVKYTDLTEDGKKFIDNYYMRLGKIDEFTIKKSVEAKSKSLENASNVNEFVQILLGVLMGMLGEDIFGVIMTLYDGFDMGSLINAWLAKKDRQITAAVNKHLDKQQSTINNIRDQIN